MDVKVQSTVQLEQFGYLPVEKSNLLHPRTSRASHRDTLDQSLNPRWFSTDESLLIPVIDMSKLHDEDEQKKLHFACKHWGFLPVNQSWIPNHIEGYGQVFVLSEEQKIDWSDMLFLIGLPVPLRNTRFWPTNPPSFRATLEKYSMELHKVMIQLMNLISKNLGTGPEMVLSYLRRNLRITIQENEKWVPVKPIPDYEQWRIQSVVHRAVVNHEKERLSIAAFHNQKMGTQIGPLQDLVQTNKALYRTVPIEEFRRLKLTSKLDGEIYDK
ncbi:hypothetical protein F3Y22_tig00113096pilonHSYRG00178 [Hibiscus syriacus]|uniref:Uncharacterized protein n=1 Tax=Hibiscus syriacus TaxID=106335 RepID=A0A6A2X3E6_HIBSY|nr:hypothetical protein F3Y22_tig00113096pilonHSYRG00178 [Hibiscus syriacus]